MDLIALADDVIGPLLCNPENQKGWPKIVKNDMMRHVNELRNLMYQVGWSFENFMVVQIESSLLLRILY